MKKAVLIFLLISTLSYGLFARGNSGKEKIYQVKLGLLHPSGHPNTLGAEKLAELLKEKTGNQIQLSVFPSSQLGNEKDMFDALVLGSLEFAILGFGEPAKQFAPFLVFDAPYIAKDREHIMRIMKSTIVAGLFEQMHQQTGILGLGSVYYGTRHLTTSNKAVRGLVDMIGLKIRVPDQEMYVATLKNMGATPTPMAFPEVYLALQQGVIDGQENPPATIAANKFYEVQKYLNKTGHIIGLNAIYVSDRFLDSLPQEWRQTVLRSGAEAADWITQKAFEQEDQYLQSIADNGVKIIDMVNRKEFMQKAKELHRQYGGAWGADLLEKFQAVP